MARGPLTAETESFHPDEAKLAGLLNSLTERVQRGETVDLDEECGRYPELAGELRGLWGAAMLADFAGSSADHRDSSTFSRRTSTTLELPCRVGDYTLLEEIGRGGMGVVYRARQESLKRIVALKMMKEDSAASPVERQRFIAEAQAAATLNHAHIVQVYETGEQDDYPFFCMRFIEGETLSARLSRGIIPTREAAQIMAHVARAIAHAHRNGILHRDLKPSNILLDKKQRPHVSDFGLAKQTTNDSSLTRTGAVLGTPSYMSPEQAAGRTEEIGAHSDIFSLGCILYYMLTGRPPFQAASPVDTLMMVIEQDPVPPRLLNRQADRDLEMIALKCLQKPKDLRYGSAEALAKDLEAYLGDETVAARSGRFMQVAANLFRETHHAPVLENWGLLWMWHSLALFTACALTDFLYWGGVTNRFYYFALWTFGLGTWAAVFWALRRRMGPVTFVERQIAHVWAGSLVCVAALFPLEWWLDVELLRLSPVIALFCGYTFLVKAGILSGSFYFQAFVMLLTAPLMALFPSVAHLIFGSLAAICFFVPGLKYYKLRLRNLRRADLAKPVSAHEEKSQHTNHQTEG